MGKDARSTDGRRIFRTDGGRESLTSSADTRRADAMLNSTESKTSRKTLGKFIFEKWRSLPRRVKTEKDALFAEPGDGLSPVRSVVGVAIIGGQLHLRLRADTRGSRRRRAGGISAGPDVRLQNWYASASGRCGTSHSSVPSGLWPLRQDRYCQMRLTDALHRPRCVLCRLGAMRAVLLGCAPTRLSQSRAGVEGRRKSQPGGLRGSCKPLLPSRGKNSFI